MSRGIWHFLKIFLDIFYESYKEERQAVCGVHIGICESLPLEGRDAFSKCAGGAFVAKAGHEALSKMPGGHFVARVGRNL